jgi:hypothetical protein
MSTPSLTLVALYVPILPVPGSCQHAMSRSEGESGNFKGSAAFAASHLS